MLKNVFVSLVVVIVLCGISCALPSASINDLLKAKSIKIYWDYGVSTNWGTGSPQIEKSKWNPEKNKSWLIIDKIDLKNGKAHIRSFDGAADVTMIDQLTGLHFIERIGLSNLSIVTIFPYKNNSGRFVAVMSRHIDFGLASGGPLPSQWYGYVEEIK